MSKKRVISLCMGFMWIVLALSGVVVLERYASRAGTKGSAVSIWPVTSKIERTAQSTLLVFLHPECSCSRATLSELDKLLARISRSVNAVAVFIRPKHWSDKQLKGELWRQANAIPNIRLFIDSSGEEAALFGAKTSGHSVLYDKNGRLLFTGGITGARGHEGDNAGKSAIAALIDGRTTAIDHTKVFGCGLFDIATAQKGRP